MSTQNEDFKPMMNASINTTVADLVARTTNYSTYIDFETRRYIVGYVPDVKSRAFLDLSGFELVDDTIAYPLMKLNSAGCITSGSCAGHFPDRNPYISFQKLTPNVQKLLENIPHSTLYANSNGIGWRFEANVVNSLEWIEVLYLLNKATEPLENEFTRWMFHNVKSDGKVYTRIGIWPTTASTDTLK